MRRGEFGDGRRLLAKAAPFGAGRLGIDGGDVVALRDQFGERRHREIRRAHEGEPES